MCYDIATLPIHTNWFFFAVALERERELAGIGWGLQVILFCIMGSLTINGTDNTA